MTNKARFGAHQDQAVPLSLGRAVVLLAAALVLWSVVAAAEEVVTLRWATWGPEHVDRQLIEAFEKEHPNIRIEYTSSAWTEHHERLKLHFAGGVGPDVFAVDGYFLVEFVSAGVMQPIDDLLAQETGFHLGEYLPMTLPDVQYEGKTYGLPYISAPEYMVYNATHMSEVGLPNPDLHWDRELYADYARRLTVTDGERVIRYGSGRFLFRGGPIWSWVWSAGGRAFDEEKTRFMLTEQEAIDVLDFLDSMHRAEIAGWGTLASETISMGPLYPAGFPSVTGVEWPFEWDVTLWPAGPGGQYSVWKGNAMAMSAATEHPEEAWTFLKFLLAPNGPGHSIYVMNNRFQPQTADLDLWNEWRLQNQSVLRTNAQNLFDVTLLLSTDQYGRALPQLLQWSEIVERHIGDALVQIRDGELSPSAAMEQIRGPIEQLLKNEP